MAQWFLYRQYDEDDRLLYVGITRKPMSRLAQHSTSPWSQRIRRVEIASCPDETAAKNMERQAIKVERPIFNVNGKAKKPSLTAEQVSLALWLAEKRGRAPLIANEQGMSRQFVHQMAQGIRPIPEWLQPYLNRLIGKQ